MCSRQTLTMTINKNQKQNVNPPVAARSNEANNWNRYRKWYPPHWLANDCCSCTVFFVVFAFADSVNDSATICKLERVKCTGKWVKAFLCQNAKMETKFSNGFFHARIAGNKRKEIWKHGIKCKALRREMRQSRNQSDLSLFRLILCFALAIQITFTSSGACVVRLCISNSKCFWWIPPPRITAEERNNNIIATLNRWCK